MNTAIHLANRFREVIFNGTFVANTNCKAQLAGLHWETAVQKTGSLNTIALLSQHLHYYIGGVLNVLEGGTLDIKDKYSFDFPPITSQEDWDKALERLWTDSEKFATAVETLTEEQLQEDFTDKKYGSYRRNIEALIDHCYYHLGQIVLIKKILANK